MPKNPPGVIKEVHHCFFLFRIRNISSAYWYLPSCPEDSPALSGMAGKQIRGFLMPQKCWQRVLHLHRVIPRLRAANPIPYTLMWSFSFLCSVRNKTRCQCIQNSWEWHWESLIIFSKGTCGQCTQLEVTSPQALGHVQPPCYHSSRYPGSRHPGMRSLESKSKSFIVKSTLRHKLKSCLYQLFWGKRKAVMGKGVRFIQTL